MNQQEKALLSILLELVNLIENNTSDIDMEEWYKKIKDSYSMIDNNEHLWMILDEMLGDIPKTYIILLDYLYTAVKREEILNKELLVLEAGIRSGDIDLFYGIFYKWQLVNRNFMLYGSRLQFIERSNVQITLLDKMRKFLGFYLEPIPKEERNKNRVVVTTTQLLGLKHGPTRNVLDYCYTLQKKLNKEVFLFVAAEMPGLEEVGYETHGINYAYFYYEEEYGDYFSLNYLGEEIRGCQCKINEDNRDQIVEMMLNIYNWKPYLIYHIGVENLIADLCGSFTDEVCVPTANGYPVTEAKYHVLTRKIEPRDKEIIKFLEDRNQKVIESLFVYKLEEPIKIYKKSDFGISEESYVIAVVGTRLTEEVSKSFMQIMQRILELNSRICFAFIGNFEGFEKCHQYFENSSRVINLGYQSDLRGVINIADLYLNPPRNGGGTSAAEALAEGVPVITLGQCDVAYTSGDVFIVDSMEDMPNQVQKYMTNNEFYETQKKEAYKQVAKIVDTEAVLKDILDCIQ